MIALLTGLSLRAKLLGLAILGMVSTVGYLYVRWRIAASKAASAAQKAQALEAARQAEKRIAERRLELSIKQRQLREELAARKSRDAFEDQGWGP